MDLLDSRGLQDKILELLVPMLWDHGYLPNFKTPLDGLTPTDEDVDAYDDLIVISEHFPSYYTPLTKEELLERAEKALSECRVVDIAQSNPMNIVRRIRHLYKDPDELGEQSATLTLRQEVLKLTVFVPMLAMLWIAWIVICNKQQFESKIALDGITRIYHRLGCPRLHGRYELVAAPEANEAPYQRCDLCKP